MNVIARILFTGGIITALVVGLSGCNQRDASTDVLQASKAKETKRVSTTDTKTTEKMEEVDHMDSMMMEMPGELSSTEKAMFKPDLPLDERIELTEELAMMMPKNGMDQILVMFPDLEKTQEIENEDPRNLMEMGLETWYYSEEADIIVVECTEANSPLHVFKGDSPSLTEVQEAKESLHEIMEFHEMMMGDEMMMDMEATTNEATTATSSLEKAEYLTYSDSLRNSLLGSKPHVLFFHAEWCPLCKGVEKNVKADLDSFPDGTKILQVDYDTEIELKKEYGIVVQSTVVVIDGDGDVVERLSAPSNEMLKESIEVSLT